VLPPNLQQVHIIHSELFSGMRIEGQDGKSYDVKPGYLGENITTKGLDVLGLSVGCRLEFVNAGEREGRVRW
jgi:MOSC domain-containing protein YiiM